MRSNIPTVDSSSLKLLIAFLIPLLLLTTCKKNEPDCPTEPCPCTGDACIDEMMAYTYFLPGTWWVYEEQNSGLRDSVYVYEAFEGENANGFRYFTVRMHSEYDGYNYYHEFSESGQLNPLIRPECELQQVFRTKTKPGDFVGTAVFIFYPIIINDYRYVGEIDQIISVDSLSYSANSNIHEAYFDIDICRSEGYEYAGFTFQPNIGVLRKYQFDQGKTWNLTAYNIIQ
jgi:hypothetical protein